MRNLFAQDDFLSYSVPVPLYLGAKYIHRRWIAQFIPDNCEVVLDAFGGSQTIAYLMKQLGKRTLTNDFMSFSHQIGKALVENSYERITNDDVEILFSNNQQPHDYNLIENLFSNLFFTESDAAFIDCFRSNLNRLENRYKRALSYAVMCRSLTRKDTMGHFAHTQALNYASNPERIKRNRSLIRPVKDFF